MAGLISGVCHGWAHERGESQGRVLDQLVMFAMSTGEEKFPHSDVCTGDGVSAV